MLHNQTGVVHVDDTMEIMDEPLWLSSFLQKPTPIELGSNSELFGQQQGPGTAEPSQLLTDQRHLTADAPGSGDSDNSRAKPASKRAKTNVEPGEQKARETNRKSVIRYRERQKEKKKEMEETLEKLTRELAEARIEQQQLSYIQQAMLKMGDYTANLLFSLQHVLNPRVPARVVTEEDVLAALNEEIKAESPEAERWFPWFMKSSRSFIRNAFIHALVEFPTDSLLRSKLVNMNVQQLLEQRQRMLDVIRYMLEDMDNNVENIEKTEKAIHDLVSLITRSMRFLLEAKPECLSDAINAAMPTVPKTPAELDGIFALLKMTEHQKTTCAQAYKAYRIKTMVFQTRAPVIHQQAAYLAHQSRFSSQTMAANCATEHLNTLTLYGTLSQYSAEMMAAAVQLGMVTYDNFSCLQIARIWDFYNPCVPDFLELFKYMDEHYACEEIEV